MAIILALQLSGVFSLASEIQGENYLTHCDQVMGIFAGRSTEATIEKRFLDQTKTQGQMAQLLRDYNLIFTKDFGEALLREVGGNATQTGQAVRRLKRINSLSDAKFNAFLWRVMDRAVSLKANNKSDIQGQIQYLQSSRLVEAIKASPSQKALAEQVLSIIVRHSIIEKLKGVIALNESGRVSRAERIIVKGAIWGGIVSGSVLSYFENGVGNHIGAFVFGGILSGLISGLATGIGVFVHSSVEGVVKGMFPPKATASPTFSFLENMSKQERRVANEAFHILDDFSVDDVKTTLSIKEGCELETCQLNPVQLAYMGHIDFLEVENLYSGVKEAFEKYNSEADVSEISNSAHAVRENPTSFMNQIKLKTSLIQFVEKMKISLESQQKTVTALTEYARSVSSEHMLTLSSKPYLAEPRNQEQMLKVALLMEKVQHDLASLETMKVNSKALSEKIDRTRSTVQALEGMLSQLPKGKEGWAEAAEEILLRLDELR